MVFTTGKLGRPIDGASQSGLEESPSAHHPVAPPQEDLEPVAVQGEDYDDSTDSVLEDDVASSTASISSSILEYRKFQGRTFHSEKYDTEYFTPNDEQQRESIDITHHYLTLLLDGELTLVPFGNNIKRVLDVGTGTGIWAIDFADKHPNVEVTGTDLSPMQPGWVPPNVKFELEDATGSWTWPDNRFDLIHMRYLIGAITDWGVLFQEAFRCCNTRGFIESGEINPAFCCDDGSIAYAPALRTWNTLGEEAGKVSGRSFRDVDNHVKLLRDAGFVDVQSVEYKVPVGGWTKDEKLRRVGQFLRATIENDLEGYTMVVWHDILNWPKDEYQIFLMNMRKALRNKRVHCYMRVRYVYGCKTGAD